MSSCDDTVLYNGYQLCVVDGSGISVSNQLKNKYGISGNGAATARATVIYDALNNIIMSGTITSYKVSEVSSAKDNIIKSSTINKSVKKLYIHDRGYNSSDYVSWLIDNDITFLVRVHRKCKLSFPEVNEKKVLKYKQKADVNRLIVKARDLVVVLPNIKSQKNEMWYWLISLN